MLVSVQYTFSSEQARPTQDCTAISRNWITLQAEPGRIPQLIQSQVPPEGLQKLQTLCQQAGVAIS